MVFRNDWYFFSIDSYLSLACQKGMNDKLFFIQKLKRVIFTKRHSFMVFINNLFTGDMSSIWSDFICSTLFNQRILGSRYYFDRM